MEGETNYKSHNVLNESLIVVSTVLNHIDLSTRGEIIASYNLGKVFAESLKKALGNPEQLKQCLMGLEIVL